ncbi:MAG: hypothetical protein AAFV29_22105, partial [Myxococcota bacterium]
LRDAELGLTRARLARINAVLDAAIAYADLIQAVGSSEWSTQTAGKTEDKTVTVKRTLAQ